MQNENRPGQKRRIGPAMQWANSRKVTRTTSAGRIYKHRQDLKHASDHEQTASGPRFYGEASTSDQGIDRGRTSDNEGSRNRGSSSLPYNPSADSAHQSSQSPADIGAEDQSAWDYYAGAVPGGSVRRSHSVEERSLNGEYASGPVPGRQHHEYYRQDGSSEYYPSPGNIPVQEDAERTDFTPTVDNQQGARGVPITQYVLPLLVVVIIVIVGVLASL